MGSPRPVPAKHTRCLRRQVAPDANYTHTHPSPNGLVHVPYKVSVSSGVDKHRVEPEWATRQGKGVGRRGVSSNQRRRLHAWRQRPLGGCGAGSFAAMGASMRVRARGGRRRPSWRWRGRGGGTWEPWQLNAAPALPDAVCHPHGPHLAAGGCVGDGDGSGSGSGPAEKFGVGSCMHLHLRSGTLAHMSEKGGA